MIVMMILIITITSSYLDFYISMRNVLYIILFHVGKTIEPFCCLYSFFFRLKCYCQKGYAFYSIRNHGAMGIMGICRLWEPPQSMGNVFFCKFTISAYQSHVGGPMSHASFFVGLLNFLAILMLQPCQTIIQYLDV